MKEEAQLGLNRTGIQMSPFDAADLMSTAASGTASAPGVESALAALRSSYIVNADPIGSVPIPGTLTGAVTVAFSALTGDRPEILLDKLGERLAVERTGTRLYDALIAKVEAMQEGTPSMRMEDLRQIRDDEARHFAILAAAIDSVGADPTAQTPCADVAGVEALGLLQVVTDPRTTLGQSLHAILIAEMVDNNGWEMLIALAEENGQTGMVTDFNAALDEERRHLQQVRRWHEEATLGVSISDNATDTGQAGSPQVH